MDAAQVNRLTEIEVEEVSLVDRPANQRKFLIIKRAQKGSDMPAPPLTPDGAGGFTSTPAPSTDPPTDVEKKWEVPKGTAEKMCPLLKECSDKCAALDKELSKAKEVEAKEGEPAPQLPPEVTSALAEVKQLVADVSAAAAPAPAPPPAMDGEPAPAEGEPAPPMAPPMAMSAPAELQMALAKAQENVEKIGAKMSKERYDRFKQALSVLATLMSELAPAEAAPAPAPAAAPAPPPAQKNDDEQSTAIAQLTETVGKLTSQVTALHKRATSAEGELANIRKTRTAGNALPAEPASQPVAKQVSWPLDLNNPIDREHVDKNISFMDDD